MFRTVTVAAKNVRIGDVIKVAGTKYEVEAISTFHGTNDIALSFKSSSTIVRYSDFYINKNAAVKICQK